jgi:hypothetical protein
MSLEPESTGIVTNQIIPVLMSAAFLLIPPICLLIYVAYATRGK